MSLLLLAPLAIAGTGDRSDPPGDEVTHVGIFGETRACTHGAVDVLQTSIVSDATHVTIRQTMRDADGRWKCAGVVPRTEVGSAQVWLQDSHPAGGHSFVAFREWARTGEAMTARQCFIVDDSDRLGCHNGALSSDTIEWRIPLKTVAWDFRGKCFQTVFGQGFVTVDDLAGYLAVSTLDHNDFTSPVCL